MIDRPRVRLAPALLLTALFVCDGRSAPPVAKNLYVHPRNPRYFTDGTQRADGSLKAVYLTGSHTWANLVDRGPSDPPPRFDFAGYLDFLQRHNHNFIRLWNRHVSWYHDYGQGELHAAPLAWSRTGPGMALDGKPRFDLTKLHHPYFDRLRARVAQARGRGIYVGVMLFGGTYECTGGWRGNPFNVANNSNGIDGDPERSGNGLKTHTLEMASTVKLQENYVRKVVDSLNDLDNVLYEISNEGHVSSAKWQHHWVRFIRAHERSLPGQHPVGITALYIEDAKENNRILASSSAHWISPMITATGVRDMPAADGLKKVSLLDSDHWFVKELYNDPLFGREWVWKAFCRGHNPILMEHLPPLSFIDHDHPLSLDDPGYIESRKAMGRTREYAERIDLAAMKPRGDLSSTGFCLADPGRAYLAYKPAGATSLSLLLEPAQYEVECYDPVKGSILARKQIHALPGRTKLDSPTTNDFVFYLTAGALARTNQQR